MPFSLLELFYAEKKGKLIAHILNFLTVRKFLKIILTINIGSVIIVLTKKTLRLRVGD